MTLLRKTIIFASMLFGLAGYLMFMLVWFAAFLNGGYIGVNINSIGEMQLELIMQIVITPIYITGLIYQWRSLKHGIPNPSL